MMPIRVQTRLPLWIALTAALICLLVFLRALSCGFVNVDDPFIVINNPDIRGLDANLLYRAFIDPQDLWIPLAWLSLALDYRFWGLNPFGYHLTSILFHAANTGLVVLVADRVLKTVQVPTPGSCGKWLYPAILLLAGLLWGTHPLRVESVVWVSERKDVLNGFFTLTSVLAYLRYVEARGSVPAARRAYLASLALFACSLMSKPVSVVLPLMLLVLDLCPLDRLRRERWRGLLLEKLPYFALSAVSALLTFHFAIHNSMLVGEGTVPPLTRLVLSGNAVMEYLRLMFLPTGIIHLYLIPGTLPVSYHLKALLALFLAVAALAAARRHPRFASTAMLFLLPLLPVLAFFQNGGQAFAARYTYLPSVAVSVAAAGLFAYGYERAGRFRPAAALAAAMAVLFLSGMTVSLTGAWQDTGALWSRYIAFRPAGSAYYFRAGHFKQTGAYQDAAEDLTVAIRMATERAMPEVFKLYALRGDVLLKAGRYDEAAADFSTALSQSPRPAFYFHRGLAREALGDPGAADDFSRAGGEVGPIEWYVEPVVK